MSTEKTTYIFNYLDKGKHAQQGTIDRFNKMDKSVDHLEGNYSSATGKMGKSSSKLKGSVNSLSSEFPLLGKAIRFATSPMGAFAITLGLGIALMHKGTERAKVFNKEFLQLEQLNLDKSTDQIGALKNSVLDLAFDKALNPEATSKAFFDIQSATGKYGSEVEKIVGRTGEFARAVQANFDSTVNAVGVATNAYKLNADELDRFLESSAKTVQVGVTTFDQLANVQSEYAGAAAAADQSFDEANKVFAVFSKTSKSVDIAATKTKGFFEDLSKLEKIDIDVFDDLGNFKKADKIIADIDKKFKKLNSAQIDKLIKNVGGNEGLRGLLKNVASNGDAVLQTFEDFDNTEFDIGDAIENANSDLDIMNDQLNNKLQVAFIRLGEVAMPLLVTIKGFFLELIDEAATFIDYLSALTDPGSYYKSKQEGFGKSADFVIQSQIDDYLGANFKDLSGDDQQLKIDELKGALSARRDFERHKFDFDDLTPAQAERQGNILSEKSSSLGGNKALSDYINQGQQNVEAIDRAFQILDNGNLNEIQDLLTPESDLDLGEPATEGGGTGKGASLSGVTVAGEKVRNVTVNITNLVNELMIQAASTDIGIEEIAEKVTSVLVRSVRDAELTLSSE